MITILLVGAADTGRAPMAAAMLQRQAEQRQLLWSIASAGVLGHDNDPPEAEARTAMAHLGLDITAHRARSASDALVEAAMLVIGIDSGTAKALRSRYPHATHIRSLGELAKRQRDIPDPFRMEVGAWITYARELDSLLTQALPQIRELVGDDQKSGVTGQESKEHGNTETEKRTTDGEQRTIALARIQRLLVVLAEMPEVVAWPAARTRIEHELAAATAPQSALDLSAAYGGLLRAALALSAPTVGQANALRHAFARLERPIIQEDVAWLSPQISGWAAL